ncbi:MULTISPECIES: AraC family transcriptional regulator [Bosea]|uniref:helix-turn-helix transcriptional regulator n=1 Tax=Bosea TaxID=85413 RepID=UPI00215008CD|nr:MULTISPECIES: AraC family transcriptional regulator [Bosea]MCR4523273.1 AraC family transcriptional regulator [Bosea sp. 47.2.35]MDR6830265.1 AraC-like DNA-binding protein [Bosea robiniae]MDR6895598.1 AraC-like DNA-binding protein [Bosea sp. BE109]MDR7138993.1 AraC-like DNA-binding protein [Bosea sp. BE168]MDR7175694.1 AraC-like DNA-binding protein [Bosea sp. BE271]
MGFQPGMRSVREGISVIGSLKCRSWNGVIADLWQAECQAGATGEYVSDHPRLFIVLDKVGGSFETRLDPSEPGVSPRGGAHSISFMPAGVPVWGRTQQRMRIRHLDLHFEPASVSERLGEALSPELLRQPRIMFTNERIQTLARLIAGECAEPDARHDLYGDGLVMAVLIDLFGVRREAPRRRTPLTSRQLRTVTDYIAEHAAGTIRLQDLAGLVGLSQSHFSHAFKASTGLPPHQWQLKARIEQGQRLLAAGDRSLTEVAVEAGFSDQAHFTRVFRRMVGETPAAWRRGTLEKALALD